MFSNLAARAFILLDLGGGGGFSGEMDAVRFCCSVAMGPLVALGGRLGNGGGGPLVPELLSGTGEGRRSAAIGATG